MGKLVPFNSSAVKKVTVKSDRSEECTQAESLIREAAQLLATADDTDSSVQWILEDCIDLLKQSVGTASPEPYTKTIASSLLHQQQIDPRRILNVNSVLDSSYRNKKKI